MTNRQNELSVYRRSFYGIPVKVTYLYFDGGECGAYAELHAVHLPGYPDIDVKKGISDEWISTFEADAIYHEQNERSQAETKPKDFEPFESLVSILGLSYIEAKDKESVTMIHLFGIRYAEDIRHCGRSVTELVNCSSIPNSYVTEVHKGMRLAKFVKPM